MNTAAEQIACAFHTATAFNSSAHGLTPLAPWGNLGPDIQASITDAFQNLIDEGIIIPSAQQAERNQALINVTYAFTQLCTTANEALTMMLEEERNGG